MDTNTCDKILKQDCDYLGDYLFSTDNIADSKHCQELCEQYEVLGCRYWVFQQNANGDKHDCLLLKGDERNCAMTGGAASPSINECTTGNNILL